MSTQIRDISLQVTVRCACGEIYSVGIPNRTGAARVLCETCNRQTVVEAAGSVIATTENIDRETEDYGVSMWSFDAGVRERGAAIFAGEGDKKGENEDAHEPG